MRTLLERVYVLVVRCAVNGREHYNKAERLIEHGPDGLPGYTRILLANVHATLALAAATAGGRRCPSCGEDEVRRIAHRDGSEHDYCGNCDYGLCSDEC